MKTYKKIIFTMSLFTSASVMANGHWEYEEKLPSGDVCYYTQNSETGNPFLALGNIVPDSVGEECQNNGSYKRAKDDLKKHPQESEMSNYDRGVDIYKACVAGAETDPGAFGNVLRRYRNKPSDINKMRKSFEYGTHVARSERDCVNYVMGY